MIYYMNFIQAFEILDIELTTDRKIIKRAYADLVKEYHPEEQPEEWQRIHDAYECAMRYAQREPEILKNQMPEFEKAPPKAEMQYEPPKPDWSKVKIPPKPKYPLGSTPEREPIQMPQFQTEDRMEDPSEQVFSNLASIADKEREKRQQEIEVALSNALERLISQSKRVFQSAERWKRLLASPEVRMVRMNTTFLYRLGDILGKIRIDYYTYKVIQQFLEGVHLDLLGGIFDEGINSTNFEAWEVASKGLYRAITGKEAGEKYQGSENAVKILWIKILKALACVAVIFVVFIVLRPLVMLNDKVGSQVSSKPTETENQVSESEEYEGEIGIITADAIIHIGAYEESGNLRVCEDSILPERTDYWGWKIKEMSVPPMVEEMAKIGDESEVVASFLVAYETEKDYTLDAVFSLEEFGLVEGQYSVWQYDKEQYCEMEIHSADEWEDGGEVIYPYVEDGLLYINTELYVGTVYMNSNNSHPVVITRMVK